MNTLIKPSARLLAVLYVIASLLQAALAVDAAEIKSVQRGTVVFTSGANSMPVTLSQAVDPSKTFIWGGVPHGGGRLNQPAPNATRIGFDLESGTTLALERLGAPANTPTVEWQAVEFSSGAFVQRGAQSLTTTDATLNVTLPFAVDTTKSFVLVSVAPNSATNNLDEQWTIRSRLTSATNLELSRNESGIAVDVYWQVIELDGAVVQRGVTTIGAGAASATAAIATVDTTKSFLVMSYRGAPASMGAEAQYTTRGMVTNSTTLTFNRVSTTNSVDVVWEVVSLTDSGAAVQSGSTSTTATSNTSISQPLTAVDLWRSFVYISAQGGSAAANTQLDEVAWTAALTSSTNLQLQRGGAGSHGTLNWQVIQFAGPVPTKLAVTSINGGSNPAAGAAFSVVVEAQDANGNGSAVAADTAVALSLNTGTGNLAGTLTGTITAGTRQATVSGVIYSKAESGVVLTATRTSGDNLTAGNSAPFTVNSGTAAILTITTQPANSEAGGTIAGPLTVEVRDSSGNLVTASTAAITVAIGTNPGGGVLSGTTVRNAVAGIATFADLSISQTGNGYTLAVSSSGLTGATSNAFNLAQPSGNITFVQTVGTATATTTGTSTIITVPAGGVGAGQSIIVTLAMNPGTGTVSCADTAGNAYSSDIDIANGSAATGVRTVVLSTQNNLALSSGNTITCTHPSVTARALSANVFAGLAGATPKDKTASATGLTTAPSSGSTATTAQPVELIFGAIGVEGPSTETFTAGASYTVAGRAGTSGGVAATNITVNPEYRIVSGIGAYAATGTLSLSRRWAAAVVTYKAGLPSATKLVITSVNGGSNPTAGAGFPVVVQSQTASSTPANVAAATNITLSLKTGTGILGGTLTGTIAAGASQTTITGVTYTKAESGVMLTATRTSGDALTPGDSAGFTVNAGAAAQLAFTTQPGSVIAGTSLSGPPTVSVRDSLGNTVTTSTAPITVAIGSNPGGGSLSGTTNRNAITGVAAFTGLSINQAGNGYTLIASSAGLTGATSSGFNVTAPSGGGTIAGVITRVSNGTAISGALVEAIQGTSIVASATTNSSGNYSIAGVAVGSYTVRASSTGLVPQMLTSVAVTNGNTTTVDLSLNIGIAIQTPIAGATINDYSVLVTGLFDTSLAPEVGIQVNGYVALQDGDEFAALVPIDATTTTLTATLTNTAGAQLAGDAVPITPQVPSSEAFVTFRPFPAIAFVSQPVSFSLTSLNEVSQMQLDGNGDGSIDFTGNTLEGVTITFAEPGLYYPNIRVTEVGGSVRTATSIIQVLDMIQLDVLLQDKWTAMKNAVRSGNTAAAATYIVNGKRATYQNVFNNLTIPFASIDQVLGNISYVAQGGANIKYEMTRIDGGTLITYMVLFGLDEDGVWRIKFF